MHQTPAGPFTRPILASDSDPSIRIRKRASYSLNGSFGEDEIVNKGGSEDPALEVTLNRLA